MYKIHRKHMKQGKKKKISGVRVTGVINWTKTSVLHVDTVNGRYQVIYEGKLVYATKHRSEKGLIKKGASVQVAQFGKTGCYKIKKSTT